MALITPRVRMPNEGLAVAPTFTPHRARLLANGTLDGVTANDPAIGDVSLVKSKGLDTTGFQEVVAAVVFAGTTTSVTIEVLIWSDKANAFIKQVTPVVFTLTATGAIRFRTDGRRFFLHISAIAGGAPNVFIEVAGAAPAPEEFA